MRKSGLLVEFLSIHELRNNCPQPEECITCIR
jgi:hypothetical protein